MSAHTCGNPVRLSIGGALRLGGAAMPARRGRFLAGLDRNRTALTLEPRGRDLVSGSIPHPPTREDCDAGALIIETSGCRPTRGHGTIGTVEMAVESGLVAPREPGVHELDTPAGPVVARNAVFRGDEAADRSPCGTGTSARMALWAARGKPGEGCDLVHESVVGSRFTGRIEGRARAGGRDAILPSVMGRARMTGYDTLLVDDPDPVARSLQVA